MRNVQIEKLIPRAIEVLQRDVASVSDKTKVSDKFTGYFSSFCAASVQSGLLPAAIFYGQRENQKEDGTTNVGPKEARWKVTWCIYAVLFPEKANSVAKDRRHAALKDYLLSQKNLSDTDKMRVLDAALALKMALRTFDPETTAEKP